MNALALTQSVLGQRIPVLCYHQVRPHSGMTPEKFGSHLDLIKTLGFQTINLTDLHRIMLGHEQTSQPAVVITFDDCTADSWIYALPELIRRNMTAVFFAITNFLEPGMVRPRSDQGGKDEVPVFGDIMRQAMAGSNRWFMNFDEIRATVFDFGMEVFPHSATHQACFIDKTAAGFLADNKHWSHGLLCGINAASNTIVHPVGSAYAHNGFGLDWDGQPLRLKAPAERLDFCLNDFSTSKMHLESILERQCPFLCLPWGQYDDITLEAARMAGFTAVLTLDRINKANKMDSFRISRLAIKDRKTLLWLATHLLIDAHGNTRSKNI